MKKRTFLGFDVTPRRALRAEVNSLKWQMQEVSEQVRQAEAERMEALKRCAALEDRLARYKRPKDSRGRFCKKTQPFSPRTARLCGLEWMTEPLSGFGGTEIDGRTYYTQDEALEAARRIGHGWRLPTKEEHAALAALGSTWVDKGPNGLPGRWFGGNHDTDHAGSVFYEASGYRASNAGALNNVGTSGYAWSSSPNSAAGVSGSYLYFISSYVNPESSYNRAYGFPVRLVRVAK